MHLVDLDQAHVRTTELDPRQCVARVAETCEVFLPRPFARSGDADRRARFPGSEPST